MKRAFTTSKAQFCSLVASLFISTLLIELTPIGPSALASEIGANDFRISDMGPDGDANFDAEGYSFYGKTGVAYNSSADQYLVVWMGDDGSEARGDSFRQVSRTVWERAGRDPIFLAHVSRACFS